MKKTIIFEPTRRVVSGREIIEYVFLFRLVDTEVVGTPDELNRSSQHFITVVASRTLASCWGFNDDQQHRVMFEYGKRHILQKVKEGTLSESEELDLHTGNAELPCPFDPSQIENPMNARIDIKSKDEKFMENSTFLQIASSIIDARDNINAIFKLKNKDKLIILREERDILQFFRDAESKEEFFYRLCALANAATQLNLQCLRRLTKIDDQKVKSIQLLESYFEICNAAKFDIFDILRNINKMRQGHPVHGDRAKGVLDAHRYFGIDYPIENYSAAWKKLLENYFKALKQMLKELKGIST